jgi:hypothetical protein
MRKLLLIIAVVFTRPLSAQDVAVLSQPNFFRPAQRFSHSIVLDCRALLPTLSGEPLSVAGRARIACDSASNALKVSVNGGAFAALGGGGVSLATDNVWTGANTFSGALLLTSSTPTSWTGGKLIGPLHSGDAAGQYEGGVQLGSVPGEFVSFLGLDQLADPFGGLCSLSPSIGIWAGGGGPGTGAYYCDSATTGTWARLLSNTGTTTLPITGAVDTSDTHDGVVTVTNTSTANFTVAIGAAASGPTSYGVRAVGGNAGVFGESVTGEVMSNGGFFVAHSSGDGTTGVTGQALEDSVNATFGGNFGNAGEHASNYGLASFSQGGPAAWLLNASTNTQPTLLIREGFGGQDASTPMIAVDDDANARNFTVRASGTIERNGGVLDLVGAGAPSGSCVSGSMYRRSDGGAASTLYICEALAWSAK